jgi:DNA-binding response OmpR family regulator
MYDKSILIVDDEDFIREAITRFFTRREFRKVLAAAKAQEALDIIEKEKPDLILLDIQLKDTIDGVEILKRTKQGLSPSSCVVMISGHMEGYDEICAKYGAADFLKKPINPNEILERCLKALGYLK